MVRACRASGIHRPRNARAWAGASLRPARRAQARRVACRASALGQGPNGSCSLKLPDRLSAQTLFLRERTQAKPLVHAARLTFAKVANIHRVIRVAFGCAG